MTDIVTGIVHDLPVSEIELWRSSLEASGFRGPVVLFAYSPEPSLCRWASRCGVRLMRIDGRPEAPKRFNKERWRLYDELIVDEDLLHCRFIATDVRDVFFQRNPSLWLDATNDALVLSSEGINYEDDPWNLLHAVDFCGPRRYESLLHGRPVINAGVVAGLGRPFASFCRQIYARMYDKPDNISDQIVLGTVAAEHQLRPRDLDEGWACHGAASRLLEKPPIIIGNDVCTPAGMPFAIVHQYAHNARWFRAIERKIKE